MKKEFKPIAMKCTKEQFLKDMGINPIEPIYFDLGDKYITISEIMESYLSHHLDKFSEEVKVDIICSNCGGYGYTVEVEAECCRNSESECCGIPIPVQVQKQCGCYQGMNFILPKDIDKVLTDYKLKNGIE